MSEFINAKKDFSVFERMSTEELKEILRQDSYAPDSDSDAVLYILEVIERRGKEKSEIEYEAGAALESFRKNYLPFAYDPEPLYGDEDDNPDDEAVEAIPFKEEADMYPNIRRRHSRAARIVLIAAVVALIVGSVSAQALGFDIFKRVAEWTRETFGFVSQTEHRPEVSLKRTVPPQLQEMADSMAAHGIGIEELPEYIPEEYMKGEFVCTEGVVTTVFLQTLMVNDSDEIQIIYTLYNDDSGNLDFGKSEFQKVDEFLEIIEISGDEYYVMVNDEKYNCSWYKDNYQGYICGLDSKDDLLNILYSIDGEQR